jgi:hypothetical protein
MSIAQVVSHDEHDIRLADLREGARGSSEERCSGGDESAACGHLNLWM